MHEMADISQKKAHEKDCKKFKGNFKRLTKHCYKKRNYKKQGPKIKSFKRKNAENVEALNLAAEHVSKLEGPAELREPEMQEDDAVDYTQYMVIGVGAEEEGEEEEQTEPEPLYEHAMEHE